MEKNLSVDLSDMGWLKLIIPPSYVHSSITGEAPSSSPKAVMSMDDVIEDGSAPRRMMTVLRVTPVVATAGLSMMHIICKKAAAAATRRLAAIFVCQFCR